MFRLADGLRNFNELNGKVQVEISKEILISMKIT